MLQEDGRAKNNMTEKILQWAPKRMWDYVCEQYGIDKQRLPLVGRGTYENRVRPQTGIAWRPDPPKEDKAAPAAKK